jgi:hypothetical protein
MEHNLWLLVHWLRRLNWSHERLLVILAHLDVVGWWRGRLSLVGVWRVHDHRLLVLHMLRWVWQTMRLLCEMAVLAIVCILLRSVIKESGLTDERLWVSCVLSFHCGGSFVWRRIYVVKLVRMLVDLMSTSKIVLEVVVVIGFTGMIHFIQ